MTATPLINILTENKLNENNYKEWKRNLMIILTCEKLKKFIHNKCPLSIQVEASKRWEKSVEIAHCYMLANVTHTLYKKLESCKTAKAILDKLEDMFGGQATLAPQSTITSLMNAQQRLSTWSKTL
ncbi:uncharacterized protein LOC105793323 [Gossypium raimondii]|uniref:uncharacterized protein LOC105793323 n=1 Tax=Gossypium raimondii TaxID=29730 RepID=UPI00063ACAF0|nr:uncharacterized protein LOC105793323 [Gossypium raimondii]